MTWDRHGRVPRPGPVEVASAFLPDLPGHTLEVWDLGGSHDCRHYRGVLYRDEGRPSYAVRATVVHNWPARPGAGAHTPINLFALARALAAAL